jgi:type II secretion system protein G
MNLLIAAALLVQDQAAVDAFRKIDEMLTKAKSVRLEYTSEFKAKRGPTDFVFLNEGTVLLKEGNKANVFARTRVMEQTDEFTTVCDGARMTVRQPRKDPVTKEAPKDFASELAGFFVRGGMYMTFAAKITAKEKKDLKALMEPVDLKMGEDDKDLKTLLFSIKFTEGTLESTLRYDPKTWIPASRTMKFLLNGQDVGTVQEQYKTLVLNGDIPDEKFKLADAPKAAPMTPAQEAAVRADLAVLRSSLGAYEGDNARYPTTEQGLLGLASKPIGAKNWQGPYLVEKLPPLDPWGNSYGYRSPGDKFPDGYDLFSCGPDGKAGTADDVWK